VVAAAARAAGIPAREGTLPNALDEARSWAIASDGVVGIAGSLFLAGEVLEQRFGDRDIYEA
jgi:hypothetical protein